VRILHLRAQPGLPNPGLAIDQRNTASPRRRTSQRPAQLPKHLRPANKRRGYHTDTPKLQGQLTPAGQPCPARTRLHTFADNNIYYIRKLLNQSTSPACSGFTVGAAAPPDRTDLPLNHPDTTDHQVQPAAELRPWFHDMYQFRSVGSREWCTDRAA
jgi:hypothetical protein